MEQVLGFFDLVFTQAGLMPNKPILAPINFGEGGYSLLVVMHLVNHCFTEVSPNSYFLRDNLILARQPLPRGKLEI